jgi:PEP-CTERM motif
VNWVPFTFPNPRFYSGIDNAVAGSQTSTGTAIVGGFVVAGANSVTSTFVQVPQASFLLQQPGAVGYAYTQLNFSIDYAVGAGGLAGGIGSAGYNVFGNVLGAGFAEFGAQAIFWDVTGAPVQLGQLNLNFLQNGAGAFNQILANNAFIAGMAGAGTLRITGDIYWHGDPADIEVQSVPEPASFVLLGSGLVGLGLYWRRRR